MTTASSPRTLYRVRDWSKLFEKAQTRKVSRLNWVSMPNRHDGAGFCRLMAHQDGLALYGGWVLIVEVASRLPMRGLLANKDGPLDAFDLAAETGGPAEVFKRALELLCTPGIAWLEKVDVDRTSTTDAATSKTRKTGSTLPAKAVKNQTDAATSKTRKTGSTLPAKAVLLPVKHDLLPVTPFGTENAVGREDKKKRREEKKEKSPLPTRPLQVLDATSLLPTARTVPKGTVSGRNLHLVKAKRSGRKKSDAICSREGYYDPREGHIVGHQGTIADESINTQARLSSEKPASGPRTRDTKSRADAAWRTKLVFRLIEALGYGSDPVRAMAQRKPLLAVARRFVLRQDRDELLDYLVTIAREKADAGLYSPAAAWQKTVDEQYPVDEQ